MVRSASVRRPGTVPRSISLSVPAAALAGSPAVPSAPLASASGTSSTKTRAEASRPGDRSALPGSSAPSEVTWLPGGTSATSSSGSRDQVATITRPAAPAASGALAARATVLAPGQEAPPEHLEAGPDVQHLLQVRPG